MGTPKLPIYFRFLIMSFLVKTIGRFCIVWLSNKSVCFVQAHVPCGQSDCERPGPHRHVHSAPRVRPDRPSQVSEPHPRILSFYPFTSLRPLDTCFHLSSLRHQTHAMLRNRKQKSYPIILYSFIKLRYRIIQ